MNKRGKQNFKNFNNIPPNNFQYNYINPNSIQPPNPNFNYYQYSNYETFSNNNPYFQDYSAQQKYNDQYNFHQVNHYYGEEARNSYEKNSIEEKLRNVTLSKTASDYIPKIKEKENINNDNNNNNNIEKRNFNGNNEKSQNFSYKNYENNSFSSDKSQNYSGLDDELIANDETDKEIWIPKYQNCECCEGFVYKCKGIACVSMDSCYCKFTEEMNEFN